MLSKKIQEVSYVVVTLQDALIPKDIKKRTDIVEKRNLSKILKEKDFECDLEANFEFAKKHNWRETVEKTVKVYREILE